MKTLKFVNPKNPRHLANIEKAMLGMYERRNKPLNIYICDISEKRTIGQNRYYWALMQIIASEVGEDRMEIHKFFKAKYLGTELLEVGGFTQRVEGSTTDLDTKNMADYIEKIHQFALEFWNIELPRPNTVPMEVYIESMN